MREHIDSNRTPDAPQDWDRYARLLREHGRVPVSSGFDERLEAEWDARVTESRRRRSLRRITAPIATLAVAAVGFLIVSESALRNAALNDTAAHEPELILVAEEEAENLAAPEIPPIWIDTNLPMIEPPVLPGMTDPSAFGWSSDSNLLHEPVTGDVRRQTSDLRSGQGN